MLFKLICSPNDAPNRNTGFLFPNVSERSVSGQEHSVIGRHRHDQSRRVIYGELREPNPVSENLAHLGAIKAPHFHSQPYEVCLTLSAEGLKLIREQQVGNDDCPGEVEQRIEKPDLLQVNEARCVTDNNSPARSQVL